MNIFEYQDYRPYLSDHISRLPKKGRGELNRMALHIGVHPSLVSQVLSRDKNLSLEQAHAVCEYLGLTNQEADCFICLVQVQRAGTPKLRDYFTAKLNEIKKASIELSSRIRQDFQLDDQQKAVFYSHWHFVAIWLATSIHGGQTLDRIVERFAISRERASEVIKFLTSANLCTASDGTYRMSSQSVHLERGSPHLHKHHTNWRLRAIEASDKVSAEELMYTAPISISLSDFKKIRSRLVELIKEVTDVAIQSDAEMLACFDIDFFRIEK